MIDMGAALGALALFVLAALALAAWALGRRRR